MVSFLHGCFKRKRSCIVGTDLRQICAMSKTKLLSTETFTGVFLGFKENKPFGFIRMDEPVTTTDNSFWEACRVRVGSYCCCCASVLVLEFSLSRRQSSFTRRPYWRTSRRATKCASTSRTIIGRGSPQVTNRNDPCSCVGQRVQLFVMIGVHISNMLRLQNWRRFAHDACLFLLRVSSNFQDVRTRSGPAW